VVALCQEWYKKFWPVPWGYSWWKWLASENWITLVYLENGH